MKDNKLVRVLVIVCLLTALFFYLKYANIGIKNTLIEQHGFRQTQTGLTAFYFIKDGLKIDYITPMYGYPWKVPMEFPLYQYCVALYKKISPINLDLAGRYVSIISLLASLVFIFLVIKELIKDVNLAIWVLPLVLINPLIIYWSRSFLIESNAVLFNLIYLYLSILLLRSNSILLFVGVSIIAIIAPISKSTTGLVFIVLSGLIYLFHLINNYEITAFKKWFLFYSPKAIFVFILPFLSIILWTKYTDHIKSAGFTSSFWVSTNERMTAWNYGTLDQKLSIDVWRQIDGFSSHFLIISLFLLIISLILRLKNWKYILTFAVAGLMGPILFTNLYFVHDYYSFANSILFSISISLFIYSFMDHYKNNFIKVLAISFAFYMAYFSVSSYLNSSYLYLQKHNNPYFKYIGENLKSMTKDEDGFVFFGMIGDPFVPYYAERKGVCMSDVFLAKMKTDTLEFLKIIEPSNIKALVVCDVNNQDLKLIQKTIDYFGLNPQPRNTDFQQMGYYIFTK